MSAASYLERVRACRCVVCSIMGTYQQTPTQAHHTESVRDEVSHYASAAICYDHHQGPNGVHGLSRRTFQMRYQLSDVDLIALTIRQLDREGI